MRLDLKTETVCLLCGTVIQKSKAEQFVSSVDTESISSSNHYAIRSFSPCCEPCFRIKCDEYGYVYGKVY